MAGKSIVNRLEQSASGVDGQEVQPLTTAPDRRTVGRFRCDPGIAGELQRGSGWRWSAVRSRGAVPCCGTEHLRHAVRTQDDAPVNDLPFVVFACAALTLAPAVLLSSMFVVPDRPPARKRCALVGVVVVTVQDCFVCAFLVVRAGSIFTSQDACLVTLEGIGQGVLLFSESHSIGIRVALVLALTGTFPVQPRKARP